MSVRTRRIESPVTKYIEYRASDSKNGKGGTFYYYDKATKKNIDIKAPFTFINIETYSTITGWNDQKGSSIYANEVLTMRQPLTVKFSKGGTMAEGLYKDIKDLVKANGGRFTQSVYAIMNDEIVKFSLKGVALGAYINRNKGDIITVSEFIEGSKGATKYLVPVFKSKNISDDDSDKLQDQYPELYAYLDEHDKGLTEYEDTGEQPFYGEEVQNIAAEEQQWTEDDTFNKQLDIKKEEWSEDDIELPNF